MIPLPSFFFDSASFPFPELILPDKPVWETTKNLQPFFRQIPLGKIDCPIPNGVTLLDKQLISIGEGTLLEPGVFIQGPCIIGKNCTIRHQAYIRPFVLLGNNCTIGHGVELKESVFFNQAAASHFNYVGNSLIGNRVNLGAGAICANYRLDGREIPIRIGEKKIASSMKKLGAIIGDDSSIGCNSVINPGILLKKNTLCHPCSCVKYSNWERSPSTQNHRKEIAY